MGGGFWSPCKHTLRMTSIAAHAFPSAMSALVEVDSLDIRLPMNDTDEVLSETEAACKDEMFEPIEFIAPRRSCALTRSRTSRR